MSKKIIAIAGPTASGKTALAVELAKRVSGEVISCDSMQVYRGMNIGTAKPDEAEKCGVPHYMIDIIEPSQKFSAKDFAEMARWCIDDVLDRGKVPILAGGTGLYMDSVLNNIGFVEFEDRPELKLKLQKMVEEKGAEALHKLLAEKDPEAAEKIHPNNVRRVIRALEVCEATGKTFTQVNAESLREPLYDAFILGIETDRSVLYDRIDRRVDVMMQKGLLDEVKALQAAGIGRNTTAMQAIGYKELLDFVEGRASLADAVDKIKQESRRYAKRQLTWFRRNENINWIRLDEDGAIDNVFQMCFEFLNKEDIL
jgi:tRNA dimethylallyltransferase